LLSQMRCQRQPAVDIGRPVGAKCCKSDATDPNCDLLVVRSSSLNAAQWEFLLHPYQTHDLCPDDLCLFSAEWSFRRSHMSQRLGEGLLLCDSLR
jgi:hypothetical protein